MAGTGDRGLTYKKQSQDLDRVTTSMSRVSPNLCLGYYELDNNVRQSSYWCSLSRNTPHLALLQSRIHEIWARLLASTLEDRLRLHAVGLLRDICIP